jgi:CDP-diacylglycerol---serine O-phosphatidyltransferase
MRITRSIVPNLFTLVNLFSGFTALIYIADGEFYKAAIFIVIAGIFDMLDGMMARLFKATSEFGVQLDSLCDVVSFGVAPAYMLYHVYFYQLGELGILLSSLPALAGVVRLARFNAKQASFDDKWYFTGLPVPAAAITIISYVIFVHNSEYLAEEYKSLAVVLLTLIISASMVSTIKFDNLPRPSKDYFRRKKLVAMMFAIGIIASAVSLGELIFPFMVLYVVSNSIRHLIFIIRERREAADDFDETEEPEPGPYDL